MRYAIVLPASIITAVTTISLATSVSLAQVSGNRGSNIVSPQTDGVCNAVDSGANSQSINGVAPPGHIDPAAVDCSTSATARSAAESSVANWSSLSQEQQNAILSAMENRMEQSGNSSLSFASSIAPQIAAEVTNQTRTDDRTTITSDDDTEYNYTQPAPAPDMVENPNSRNGVSMEMCDASFSADGNSGWNASLVVPVVGGGLGGGRYNPTREIRAIQTRGFDLFTRVVTRGCPGQQTPPPEVEVEIPPNVPAIPVTPPNGDVPQLN